MGLLQYQASSFKNFLKYLNILINTSLNIKKKNTICYGKGSDDKSIIIWDTKRGLQLTSLQLHIPIINLDASSDCSRIIVHLKENQYLPIICLHNTPAKYVKLPTYCTPAKDIPGIFKYEEIRAKGHFIAINKF